MHAYLATAINISWQALT